MIEKRARLSESRSSIDRIARLLPYRLHRRLESVGSWVDGMIDDELHGLGDVERRDIDREYIKLAAFVYLLDSLFLRGSQVAEAAASAFEAQGMNGFQVGGTRFTSTSDTSRLGKRLSDALHDALADTTLDRHLKAGSLKALVRALLREMGSSEIVARQGSDEGED